MSKNIYKRLYKDTNIKRGESGSNTQIGRRATLTGTRA